MPTATETYALISDITPNRATVEFVGSQEEAEAAGMHADADADAGCLIVPVKDGVSVDVGDRVWIDRAGQRVLRVSAGE
jgi:hypothetical protein